MRTTPRSEAEAAKASRRTLLKPGEYDGRFREAVERQSKRGNDMIEVVVVVSAGDGTEREFRDFLTIRPWARRVCATPAKPWGPWRSMRPGKSIGTTSPAILSASASASRKSGLAGWQLY